MLISLSIYIYFYFFVSTPSDTDEIALNFFYAINDLSPNYPFPLQMPLREGVNNHRGTVKVFSDVPFLYIYINTYIIM